MKQITKTYTVYSFDELSEDAQQKAIEKLYDINVDYDWWNGVYDDAEQIGLKIDSFDIDRGSYCDGDFIGTANNTANLILANHGTTCETYKTAQSFLSDLKAIEENKDLYLDADTEELDESAMDDDIEELEDEFLKSLCEDYRIILQKEYEYLTSEEAIKETIEANEYTFLEDGTLKNF